MYFLPQRAELLDRCELSQEAVYKRLELIGRICHNSEERIGEGTDKIFVEKYILSSKHRHESLLGHIRVAITVQYDKVDDLQPIMTAMFKGESMRFARQVYQRGVHIGYEATLRHWKDYCNSFSSVVSIEELSIVDILWQKFPGMFEQERRLAIRQYLNFMNEQFGVGTVIPGAMVIPLQIFMPDDYFTVKLTTTRNIAYQLIRHRTAVETDSDSCEFNLPSVAELPENFQHEETQMSQRYCDMSNVPTIIDPDLSPSELSDVSAVTKLAEEVYAKLIRAGHKKEVARNVLPGNTMTVIYLTLTKYNWDRLLQLRLHDAADAAMIRLLTPVKAQLDKATNNMLGLPWVLTE